MIFSRSLRIERTQGKVSSPWKTSKVCSECPRPCLDGYFFNRFPLFCAALLWKMLKLSIHSRAVVEISNVIGLSRDIFSFFYKPLIRHKR